MNDDFKLKEFLVERIPNVYLYHGDMYYHAVENKRPHRLILDTELLDLCNQVEVTLKWKQYSIFKRELNNQLMRTESAVWQQRVKALKAALEIP